jgi:hypothetical protein
MKAHLHAALDHDDKDLLYQWAKEGDRNVSQQISRLIRQERDRLQAERSGGRANTPPIEVAESVKS